MELTFIGLVMRKERWENLTLAVHIEGKSDKGKQHKRCLTSFCEWLTEQGLGEITKSRTFTKSYNGEETVERHAHPCPE